MNALLLRLPFLRMFGSAVLDQALLSASNLLVGLILIRHGSDLQYGYYVLILGAVMLAVSLQNAFIAPSMINRMTTLDAEGRGRLTGGLYVEQQRLVRIGSLLATGVVLLLWMSGRLSHDVTPLVFCAVFAVALSLRREYFRMVLMAYRRSADVLRADTVYALLLVAAVFCASLSPAPAAVAAIGLGLAALVGGILLFRLLRKRETWSTDGERGILRQIAPLGLWSAAGAVIHWTFSHGYTYLVAATLDVTAVAAIAATRLLLMPVNLLSTGIGSLMLPLTSGWLHAHGAPLVLRRLGQFATGVTAAAALYLLLLWLSRDWVFAHVLKKQFAHSDTLLLLWFGVFLLMVARDQMIYLLIARERFRSLAALTGVSAVVSLLVSFEAMRHLGVIGAPLGVLVGEAINVTGILALSWRESSRSLPAPA